MDTLFNYFASQDYIIAALIMIGASLLISVLFTFVVSLKLRSTKGYFVTSLLMPVVITSIISMMSIFLNTFSSEMVRIVTLAVALGLIRFRSFSARAEEMLILFADVAIGFICGLGYLVIALIVAVVISGLYILFTSLHIFDGKRFKGEKLLKITIPESLEYSDVFDETFKSYLKKYELIGVKTTDMGSLFKLSYKIELKDNNKEKQFIDELRIKNGNLEISILPYVEDAKML